MRFRLLFPIALMALAMVLPLGAGAFAADDADAKADAKSAAAAVADKCQGVDMLAETASKDPQGYSRIMSEAAATQNAGAILWKIERPGHPASYLFGTVHLTDERVTQLSPAVNA